MKKLFALTMLLIGIFSVSTMNTIQVSYTAETDIDYLDIYYLNDFHGAILPSDSNIGLANISNLIITEKEANPDNVIVLAGGDILQGSALSNYYYGESTINMMNEMYFDAFTIGNHEFDWGFDIIQGYRDGDLTNGEAAFPLLGANIHLENTNDIPDGIDPYVIIERGNLKIGIIGTIGFGLESSIATSKVAGYEFASPVPIIEDLVYELRTVKNVDLVFVLSHDSGDINSSVAALTGDYKVDAIFNGHSHRSYTYSNLGIPVIQSGSTGQYVGYIRLNMSGSEVTSFTVDNLAESDNILLQSPNQKVQDIVDFYQGETAALFDTPIITNKFDLSTTDLTYWIAELMRVNTEADIAFHNFGGTRTSINAGEVIDLSKLYDVWPFDNYIMTVNLYGSQIKTLMSGGDAYSTNITDFDDDTLYRVATNDYIFDKESNPYLYGDNPQNTYLFFRDIAAAELTLQSDVYDYFTVDNTIQYQASVDTPVDDTTVDTTDIDDDSNTTQIIIYSIVGVTSFIGGAFIVKKFI